MTYDMQILFDKMQAFEIRGGSTAIIRRLQAQRSSTVFASAEIESRDCGLDLQTQDPCGSFLDVPQAMQPAAQLSGAWQSSKGFW